MNVLKSFEFDGIHDNAMRKFTCWGSVEVLDRHGEIIPADEIFKVMDIWMDRGAPIMFNHTNRNVGRGLNWQKLEKNGKPGVLITGVIHKHYKEDDDVWESIKKGEFEGLSIGGKSFKREQTEQGTILRDLIGYEFSVVERTGNQEATFTEVNQMAKSKEIKKDEPVMDENTEQKNEEVIAELQRMVQALVDKVNGLEEKIAGAPEEEEAVAENEEGEEEVQENEEEEVQENEESEEEKDEEEVEENEEEDSEVEKLRKELKDLKKSLVKEVVKAVRPAETPAKKEDAHTVIRKQLKEMSSNGKIDFKQIGAKLRGN